MISPNKVQELLQAECCSPEEVLELLKAQAIHLTAYPAVSTNVRDCVPYIFFHEGRFFDLLVHEKNYFQDRSAPYFFEFQEAAFLQRLREHLHGSDRYPKQYLEPFSVPKRVLEATLAFSDRLNHLLGELESSENWIRLYDDAWLEEWKEDVYIRRYPPENWKRVALHRRGTLKEVQPEEDWIGQKRIKEALGTYPERTVTSIPQKVFDALASNEEAALQILAEIDRGTLGVEGLWRHSVEVYAPAGYFAVRLQSPVGASTPKNRVLRLIPRNRNQILVAIHERLRGTKPRKKTSFPPISEELRQILDKTLVPDRFYDWFRKGIFKIGGGLTTDSHSIVAYSEIKERIDEEQLREALEQGHYGWLEFFTDL